MTAIHPAPPDSIMLHPHQAENRSVPRSSPATDLATIEKTLRVAFLARYGTDVGQDVTAETMAWAWEHRVELDGMDNPVGYLFRVGQSKSRRFLRWKRERVKLPPERPRSNGAWTEPQLPEALAKLGEQERTAVILVHCFQWTYAEVADLLDLPLHTVRNRIHRGLTQLRTSLGVNLND